MRVAIIKEDSTPLETLSRSRNVNIANPMMMGARVSRVTNHYVRRPTSKRSPKISCLSLHISLSLNDFPWDLPKITLCLSLNMEILIISFKKWSVDSHAFFLS